MINITNFKKIMIYFCAMSLFLICFSNAIAGDQFESKNTVIVEDHQKDNCSLTSRSEDKFVIDDEHYIFNSQTEISFLYEDNSSIKIEINKIEFPSNVDITYQTFSHYTELMPYNTDDKLLTKIIINQILSKE